MMGVWVGPPPRPRALFLSLFAAHTSFPSYAVTVSATPVVASVQVSSGA